MAGMELRIFKQSSEVGFFEADVKLRMSPVAYWRVLQNAAAGHAAQLSAATEELRKAGQTWMLSKMCIEVSRHPRLGETIHVETWPSTRIKGARAYRDYVLKDAEGQVCVAASSLWVIVDLASRRPVRIPDSIIALCCDPGYAIPPITEGWLSEPAPGSASFRFPTVWSDADQNEHVNNVAMLRWVIDAQPLSFLETNELIGAEAHYRAEVGLGKEVVVTTSTEGSHLRHAIHCDGTLAALIHTRWRSLDSPAVTP
jgi:medium-chain acyl-[acyl-carrier-protein] hydrolase